MVGFFIFIGLLIAGISSAFGYWRISTATFAQYGILAGLALIGLQLILIMLRGKKKRSSIISILLVVASLAALGFFGVQVYKFPASDITTAPKAPPQFRHPLYSIPVQNGAELLDKSFLIDRPYTEGSAALQAQNYPFLEPVSVNAPPAEVFSAIEKLVKSEFPDWKIVLSDPANFHLEAEEESTFFHFVDDIVLEVRPIAAKPGSSKIEIRSRGREGLTDFGRNGRRAFILVARLLPIVKEVEQKTVKTATPAPAVPSLASDSTKAPAPPKEDP